jgi:hypothetical protein
MLAQGKAATIPGQEHLVHASIERREDQILVRVAADASK